MWRQQEAAVGRQASGGDAAAPATGRSTAASGRAVLHPDLGTEHGAAPRAPQHTGWHSAPLGDRLYAAAFGLSTGPVLTHCRAIAPAAVRPPPGCLDRSPAGPSQSQVLQGPKEGAKRSKCVIEVGEQIASRDAGGVRRDGAFIADGREAFVWLLRAA